MNAATTAEALKALEARSLGSDEDREEWLAARRKVVTATEAKSISIGGPVTRGKERARLVAEKVSGESAFSGNHFTHWGKLREPFILAELRERFQIEPCGLLVAAEENPRYAATPDGVRVSPFGDLELAEIKTSKNDVAPGSGRTWEGYLLQMQWQMLCTGAARVLYVWERHDDNWAGWDLRDPDTWTLEAGPTPEPIRWEWISRDEAQVASLMKSADLLLEELDRALETGEVAAKADADVAALLADLFSARREHEAAEAAMLSRLEELMRERDLEAQSVPGIGSATFAVPAPQIRFDSTGFKAKHPDLYEKFRKPTTASDQPRLSVRAASTKKEK